MWHITTSKEREGRLILETPYLLNFEDASAQSGGQALMEVFGVHKVDQME
jgi:hypothetical protein